ncbi:class I adenylate-forming enzyme family protein [Actinomadura roseirufa]|uniref:class I adenylate-forming enzyme family protein n=1 Tax=Actinomadura roseirufa TaxID=2094049 RepID=UPI001041AB7D|nr:fatty acid--CoA ligase family protein [Actinomadura roseirufa]
MPDPLFPSALLEAFAASPGTVAFEHGPRRVTRGEVLDMIARLAESLAGAGLGRGRGLAIATAVSPEAFAAHMAAHALGCRVVGVRPGYPAAQLAHVLGSGADALLVDRTTAGPVMTRAAGAVPLLSLGPCAGARDLLARGGAARQVAVAGRPGDVAALTFTSGSTGRPKGCAITYGALTAHWAWQPAVWSPVAAELAAGFERYLLFGTLASMVVFEFLGPCLLGGGTAVIPEDDGRPLFPDALRRHRITGSIITVPRLYGMLAALRGGAGGDLDLRALMVSGSPIGPHRLAEAADRLGPVVYQGYGQTEAGSISVLTPADIAAGAPGVLASVGRPHPGVEISVRDERGAEVADGVTGEIHVRSPYLMAGYWRRPEETREALRDGWLRTRDLGHRGRDGLLHLSGRTRDVIMVNAMVVYAGPIERALAAHREVGEAHVVGAPDERTGEAVHAFVVPAAGAAGPAADQGAARGAVLAPRLAAELAELVRAELGEDSVPRTITIVPGVPVAASGKPDKHALLARHAPRLL